MTNDIPTAVDRFLAAQQAADVDALAACFLPRRRRPGRGPDPHRPRRDHRVAPDGADTYTSEVTGHERLGPDAYKVIQHLEGDFPGGVADLDYRLALAGDHVAALMIFLVKR